MSEKPSWMPSDEEIRDAWFTVAPFLRHSTHAILDATPIRALIRAAVEKALAEQEARHREDLRVITEATRMAADKRAKRHKRELIEARLDEIDNVASDAESSPKRGESVCEQWVYDWSRERETQLRAELAALDKEVDK